MKFISKPKVITAEQFFPQEELWPINVVLIDRQYMVWNDLHNCYVDIKPGDWIRTDNPEDTYPIDSNVLNENYEPYDES